MVYKIPPGGEVNHIWPLAYIVFNVVFGYIAGLFRLYWESANYLIER